MSGEKGAIARRRGVKDGRKGAPCTVFFVACRCRLLVCVASCKALSPFCPLHTHCNVVCFLAVHVAAPACAAGVGEPSALRLFSM